jgi:hypothetical protein
MKKVYNVKYLFLISLILLLAGCLPITVKIITPSDGDHFEVGELIIFTGLASDPAGGELTGDSLVWTSSIDDEIGTGVTVSRADLSEGEHTITLTVTSSQGMGNPASITITIGEGSSSTTTTTSTLTTTTTTITSISGELEIDKILGPLMVSMEAELMIPFHLEGTEIVAEGGPWMTPISGSGEDVPFLEDCTIDYTGEFSIRNVGGELLTSDPNKPFIRFTYEEYETEFWTVTCPDGSFSDEWTPGWRDSECGMDLVDGATWGGGPNTRFRCTLHLDSTP